MMLVYIILIPTLLWLYVVFRRKSPLDAIPGPNQLPFVGNALQLDRKRPQNTFLEWAKKYGPVLRVKLFNDDFILISGAKELHEILVTNGKDFAGRPDSFRLKVGSSLVSIVL